MKFNRGIPRLIFHRVKSIVVVCRQAIREAPIVPILQPVVPIDEILKQFRRA